MDIDIDLGFSPIPDGCTRLLTEVTIKRDGHVWRIHQSDPDPFPSKPHVHNLESGLKLDLSNGRLYCGTHDTGRAINAKRLAAIRDIATSRGVSLPPLAA